MITQLGQEVSSMELYSNALIKDIPSYTYLANLCAKLHPKTPNINNTLKQ